MEDETNGLLTFDRKEAKVKPEELRDVSEQLLAALPEEPAANP